MGRVVNSHELWHHDLEPHFASLQAIRHLAREAA